MKVTSCCLLGILINAFSGYAVALDKDLTLRFENIPYKNAEVYCENDQKIKPTANDFELIDYTAMSSDQGNRYVLATIRNKSSGQRLFNQNHIIAILGDCSRIKPLSVEQKYEGKQTITTQLNFGVSRYPILKVITE